MEDTKKLLADAGTFLKSGHHVAPHSVLAQSLTLLRRLRDHLATIPVRQQLRTLVDVVWNEATESTMVPSTKWADRLIGQVYPQLEEDPYHAIVATPFYPAEEWHDELGDVLWWTFPIQEPPYVGSPLDTDWDYRCGYTHFQRFDYRAYDNDAAVTTPPPTPWPRERAD